MALNDVPSWNLHPGPQAHAPHRPVGRGLDRKRQPGDPADEVEGAAELLHQRLVELARGELVGRRAGIERVERAPDADPGPR